MRVLGILSYDGASFAGFQTQPELRTVEGELEKVLSSLLGEDINVHGAGRTDAGVSAKGQAFSFSYRKEFAPEELRVALNRLLPKDMVVLSLKEVRDDFDARHDAVGKVYSYALHYGERDPFAKYEWQLEVPGFDPDLFKKAIKLYEGTHNFQNFTSKESDGKGFVRTISEVKIIEDGSHIKVYFHGNGFMRYMVRNLVGAAVKAAYKKLSLSAIEEKLNSEERNPFSYLASPVGLVLEEVKYE